VTADHLDRHGSIEAYRKVKRRLAELVDPGGALVLNSDDPVVYGYAEAARARVITYRRGQPASGGVGVEDGWIVSAGVRRLEVAAGGVAEAGPGGLILPSPNLPFRASTMFRTLWLRWLRPSCSAWHRTPSRRRRSFAGVEHRLEQVAIIDRVRFVNDSQGTQPDAVIAALRSFPRPLVLIAGGRDKGVDLSGLGPVAAERADAAC